ncbi:MAG: histidine phosphatase family protein [Candidatus Nomurabacteria bacterium]
MFTKYFYLVRHGETILNKEKRRQGSEGKLSENGVNEVEELSKRLLNMNIDRMFVSPYERTRQTASIINSHLNLPENKITITELLAERKNPSIIIGQSYDDPVAKSFVEIMDKTIHDPDLRLYDEENFADLRDRSIRAQKYLIKNSSAHTLCITHGIFLKMFLSTLLYGKNLTVKQHAEMNSYNPADNAGVTLVKYEPIKVFTRPFKKFFRSLLNDEQNKNEEINLPEKDSPWTILAYNDYTRDGFQKMHI